MRYIKVLPVNATVQDAMKAIRGAMVHTGAMTKEQANAAYDEVIGEINYLIEFGHSFTMNTITREWIIATGGMIKIVTIY